MLSLLPLPLLLLLLLLLLSPTIAGEDEANLTTHTGYVYISTDNKEEEYFNHQYNE